MIRKMAYRKGAISFGLLVCMLITTAQAQPEVEIVFESMFGQHGFFQNGVPPNGFSSPTGITFNADDDVLIADQGNLQVQRCDLEGNCSWMGLLFF